jgi:hypothetical protein
VLPLLATTMIAGAFSSGFDWLYPLRVFAVAIVLWLFRRSYAGLRSTWSWAPVAIGSLAFAVWMALEPVPQSCLLPTSSEAT